MNRSAVSPPFGPKVPHGEPAARPGERSTAVNHAYCLALLLCPLVVSTVLAKFSLPGLSSRGLGISIPLVLLASGIGLAIGALEIHRRHSLIYLFMLSWIMGVQVLFDKPYSLNSLALLAVLFFPCVLRLRAAGPQQAEALQQQSLRAFSWLAGAFSVLGIAQYAAQFVVPASIAFPIEHWLPKPLLIKAFNYLNPLYYGASVFKSNGIVFLEPSFFSQFIALGLLLELSLWNRLPRIGLMLAALVVSYSGTGIVMLACGGAVILVVQRRWQLLLGCAVAFVIAIPLADVLSLDVFLNRATEFQYSGSSGFERFVAWTHMFAQHWWPYQERIIFGTGTGTFAGFSAKSLYPAAEMSFSKIFFEFGLIGGGMFFLLLTVGIFSCAAPVAVKVGLFASLFLNGAYSAPALGLLLTIAFWPNFSDSDKG